MCRHLRLVPISTSYRNSNSSSDGEVDHSINIPNDHFRSTYYARDPFGYHDAWFASTPPGHRIPAFCIRCRYSSWDIQPSVYEATCRHTRTRGQTSHLNLGRAYLRTKARRTQKSGRFTVLFDSGVRMGSDIPKAFAIGAEGVLRGYIHV
ncbi:hypothetical protein EDC04DRAFT_1657815 [Pisolithus marmoratus]|nr:hypothetical protein EDC04DRAFT_1657815 [Pisolithus marmoratus]